MSKSKQFFDNKVDLVVNELKIQLEQAIEDIKNDVKTEFSNLMQDDLKQLEQSLSRSVRGGDIFSQSEKAVQKIIRQQFGGNIFGDILAGAILPAIFKGAGGSFNSGSLNQSSNQQFMEISKAISRSSAKNG